MNSKRLIRILWGILSGGLTVAILQHWNGTHFTWWSLAFFLQYCIYGCLGREHDLFWFFMTIQALVIGGVIFMSGTGCRLFHTTEKETGQLVYFWGNFAMHYAPALIALALTHAPLPIGSLHRNLIDILLGHASFLIYCGIIDPSKVYTCTVSDAWIQVGTLCVVGGLGVLRWKLHA
jgi:hypothetical protein